ncbi:MAG: hypothetical protein CMJ59_14500 [Planctomycetaceae bacterium]|nr:hypothetical protein [Planctomycetaceae bacterium]
MKKNYLPNLLWATAYGIFLAIIVGALFWVRDNVSRQFQTAEAQAAWNRWRQEAARQAQGEGPVQRRVPKSAQPPIAVLMSQHFPVCVTAAITLGSALFGTFMFLIRGVWRDSSRIGHAPPTDVPLRTGQ